LNDIKLTSLGWELALPIVGGAVLGHKVDQLLSRNYTFTIIFLVIGIIAGYYSVYKYIAYEMLRVKLQKHRQENKNGIS
jgi:F0F1-type ATP synthase assembly protein I